MTIRRYLRIPHGCHKATMNAMVRSFAVTPSIDGHRSVGGGRGAVPVEAGYFEVTADVTSWTKAAFLGEQGYADTDRDPRGFALKFYTEEGNYDLVGN